MSPPPPVTCLKCTLRLFRGFNIKTNDLEVWNKGHNLQAVLGLLILTLASAAFIASALNCGFSAARTALAQIAEKRM